MYSGVFSSRVYVANLRRDSVSSYFGKRGVTMHICFVYAKRGEVFGEFIYFYFLIYAYIWLFGLCISLYINLFIAMHELRGSFNPCIYNSMSFVIIKKGEIVDPKTHHASFDDD